MPPPSGGFPPPSCQDVSRGLQVAVSAGADQLLRDRSPRPCPAPQDYETPDGEASKIVYNEPTEYGGVRALARLRTPPPAERPRLSWAPLRARCCCAHSRLQLCRLNCPSLPHACACPLLFHASKTSSSSARLAPPIKPAQGSFRTYARLTGACDPPAALGVEMSADLQEGLPGPGARAAQGGLTRRRGPVPC